ncbi:MAG: prolipoprotein diacylglyceryl transferase [Deltaproteobacteria bacterium]|jgi:prolipoprotein diacylglyceryl transferase|nr:prolipoprotein diacylglyceryl transferase [Deltaproteobacteria bacterium]MBW2533935.1 prolipoprotein diacylglyceryl transferase [Deltaproteobacteria bacterium]
MFTWDVDPVLFHIAAFPVRYYTLLFIAVFVGGFFPLRWQIVRGGGTRDDAIDITIYTMVAVLVGSRLGHVLYYDLDRALVDPLWVLQFWQGGLSSHGATVGILVMLFIVGRRRRVSFVEACDRITFSVAIGATLVRVGNFINSEIVGRLTDQNWGVRFPRYDRIAEPPLRHPSQLYEVALGLAVLAALVLLDRRCGREQRPRGLMISTFFAAYFTGRFIVELFKEYQTLSPSSALTMGQYLSIPFALLGYYGLYWSLTRKRPAGWRQ